ncbi:AAA family ATPase [Nissabacter archeti]|uniref:Uncharacterized AAA domain-containing protein ycf46 n=1 Tax=Nissabacter archeti TaxID=1917880 RepID=A0ABS5JLF2_9GAMM|nr:AAA family ATPase [Nissabacter archeti]MBS0970762.1 AAA family ATPase [Nissabacter archeti]
MDIEMMSRLHTWILAGHGGFYLQSAEDERVDSLIAALAKETGMRICEWNLAWGWVNAQNKTPLSLAAEQTPQLALHLAELLHDDLENTLIVIKNAHAALEGNALVAARLQQLLLRIQRHHQRECAVICVDERAAIPALVESQMTLVTLPLPQRTDIEQQILCFANVRGISLKNELLQQLSALLSGLTSREIEQTLSVALVNHQALNDDALETLLSEKEQIIAKSGVLEMIKVRETFQDIGGLENLKAWLERKAAILKRLGDAQQLGLPAPKGVLVAGMPGCGKSLTAKAVASLFHLPLLRLDIGSLLGKYVGESEHNMRRALAMAETISPCVLWVDELEKAFVGIGGQGGSEVTARLLGYFLTWMQEKRGAVFVVATANNIEVLPPELLRKGRFDEVFYVGFPHIAERRAILSLQLKTHWHTFSEAQQQMLARRCRDFSGADIQNAVHEAREQAFLSNTELNFDTVLHAIDNTVPLRETLRDSVSKYEVLFEKMKLKPASCQEGLSLAQMIALVNHVNPHDRLRVASHEECTVDLLTQLAQDSNQDVRRAVLNNPNCDEKILSAYLVDAQNKTKHDESLLELAICHPNAPENLQYDLAKAGQLSDKIILRLLSLSHCPARMLAYFAQRQEVKLLVPLLAHPNLSEEDRELHINSKNPQLRAALAGNPTLSLPHQQKLVNDRDVSVRCALAGNRHLSEQIIVQLAMDREHSVLGTLAFTHQVQGNHANTPDIETLVERLHSGNENDLRSLAEIPLPTELQYQFISKVHDEDILAIFARNTDLNPPIQQRLASEGSEIVRQSLAGNLTLVSDVQNYLFKTSQSETKKELAKNPSLSLMVQHYMMRADTDIRCALATNTALDPKLQESLITKGNYAEITALASNPALSAQLQHHIFDKSSRFSNHHVELAKNPNVTRAIIDQLLAKEDKMVNAQLAMNPNIGVELLLTFAQSQDQQTQLGVAGNIAATEEVQAALMHGAEHVLQRLAAHPHLAPAQQWVLAGKGHYEVVIELLQNSAVTERCRELCLEILRTSVQHQGKLIKNIESLTAEVSSLTEEKKFTAGFAARFVGSRSEKDRYVKLSGAQHRLGVLTAIQHSIRSL